MSDQNMVPETATLTEALPQHIQTACDIAADRVQASPDDEGISIVGAQKNKNSNGRGDEWYRMVWRGGSWKYVSDDRLPSGNFLAADRRAKVYGEVYPGEIIVAHDRGGQVECAYLVYAQDGEEFILAQNRIEFTRRRDGKLSFTLPDNSTVVLLDPRKKS